MKILILLICLFGFEEYLQAEIISIDQAVQLAEKKSIPLKVANEGIQSSSYLVSSQKGLLLPKLSLDGFYKYQAVIPTMQVGPKSLQLTDNNTYSLGPTLTYTLWDNGLKNEQIKTTEYLILAKTAQREQTAAQLRLSTKIAYIQSVLMAETAKISKDLYTLSLTQNKDIQDRKRSGVVSSLDALTSDSVVLNYKLRVEQAQSDLNVSLAELNYYIGESVLPENLDTLSHLNSNLDSKRKIIFDSEKSQEHPSAKVQKGYELAARAQASAYNANTLPIINLQLRASMDYPNGPNFENIFQKSLIVNFSWNIWDFNSTQYLVVSSLADAKSAKFQKQEIISVLEKEKQKLAIKMKGLEEQIAQADAIVKKQVMVAQLNYSTYRFGKLIFSEVQTANLQLLEAQIRLVSLQAQYLIQIYNYQYLMEGA